MNTLKITTENQRAYESGRVGYGSTWFSGRGGGYETCQVSLSKEAAAIAQIGDVIEWGDSGSSEWCYQSCVGELTKADGTVYELIGSRDLGIDTGHTPRLGLKKVKKWRLVWSWDYEAPESSFQLIKDTETGILYRDRLRIAEGDLNYDRVVERCEVFVSPTLASNQKLSFSAVYDDSRRFKIINATILKKEVCKVNTDKSVVKALEIA